MSETYESGTSPNSASKQHDDGFTLKLERQAGSAKERLHGFANRQKDAGLDQVSGFASAAHKAADAVGEQNSGIADLIHEAADGLDRMSTNLRDRDVSDIYGSLHDFARRQPLVFLAGSFVAGILLTRFLKSSADKSEQAAQPYHPSPSL